MTHSDADALRRLINALAYPSSPDEDLQVPGPVVTVSRMGASGGRELATALGERLGVPVYDRALLDAVAEESGIDRETLARLDERVEGLRGAWLRSLFTGQDLLKSSFRRNLVNAILGIACRGGIIVGRGANYVLAGHPCLRLRVVASPSVCARRLTRSQGLAVDQSRAEIDAFNRARSRFVRSLYSQDIDNPLAYDVVLNTDHLAMEPALESLLPLVPGS